MPYCRQPKLNEADFVIRSKKCFVLIREVKSSLPIRFYGVVLKLRVTRCYIISALMACWLDPICLLPCVSYQNFSFVRCWSKVFVLCA